MNTLYFRNLMAGWQRGETIPLVILFGGTAVLFLAMVAASWLGYIGSDDGNYVLGAYGWINEFPFVGGHPTIRHTVTGLMALSILAFGENEVALVVPTLFFGAGLTVIGLQLVRQTGIQLAVVFAVLAIATHPNFILWASVASADITEAFFIFLSLYLFLRSIETEDRKLLFLAGMSAGLAFMTRETTVFFLAAYGVLFLAGYGPRRIEYFVMAFGFAAIWLLEVLYLTIMTGDPFYRLKVSANHDSTIDRSIDLAGNFIIHPAIDPLLTVLINQEFGLLFWIGIPLAILWVIRKTPAQLMADRFVTPVLTVSIVWYVCAAIATTLLPLNPRYFLICSMGFSLLTAYFLAEMFTRNQRAASIIMAALVVTNLLCIYVDNKQHMFAERNLVEVSADFDGNFITDQRTLRKADLLLKWAGTRQKFDNSSLQAGDLVYKNLTPSRRLLVGEKSLEDFLSENRLSLDLIGEYHPQPRIAGRILVWMGLDGLVPASILNKIYLGHPGAELYRVSPLDQQ